MIFIIKDTLWYKVKFILLFLAYYILPVPCRTVAF